MAAPAVAVAAPPVRGPDMLGALARHWPAYLLEAGGLALFVAIASAFTTALEYPGSAVHQVIASAVWRRVVLGAGLGAAYADPAVDYVVTKPGPRGPARGPRRRSGRSSPSRSC